MPSLYSTRSTTVVSIALLAVALLPGCGGSAPDAPAVTRNVPTPSPAPEPDLRVVVLGDSLAAGLGLPKAEAFPAVVEARLRDRGLDVEVVNAGVSGDTSAGGLGRLDWVLQRPADVLVVELGGNDALRGQPVEHTEANLREIVRRGRATGAQVVLLGMDLPINYGPEYGSAFASLYPRVADEEGAVLVPGFVRDLGSEPELLQSDGLHPTAEGQRRLAERLLPVLIELLENR
ncbi:MAG: arylesterase [Holophagae bacterium]|jgi:acyl-CoA thioesterase-1